MSPEQAVGIRDGLVQMLQSLEVRLSADFCPGLTTGISSILGESAAQNVGSRLTPLILAWVNRSLPVCDLLIWSGELYTAATAGCEAFEGSLFEPGLVPSRPHLWLFDLPDGARLGDTVEPPHDLSVSAVLIGPGQLSPSTGVYFLAAYILTGAEGAVYRLHVRLRAMLGDQGVIRLTSAPVVACLSFLQADLGYPVESPLPRPERRRREKAKLAVPLVRTVVLRRSSQPGGDSTERTYHRQWIVGGHWRHLPQPRKADGKPITWVRPHTKGPAGAPLLAPKTNVYHVKR